MTLDSHIDDNSDNTAQTPLVSSTIFSIGDIVKHRLFEFRGVIFDVDPVFSNSEEWYQAIPEHLRPARNQPYYHLYAENPESSYEAYVSQQNLLNDEDSGPVNHPAIKAMFEPFADGKYKILPVHRH